MTNPAVNFLSLLKSNNTLGNATIQANLTKQNDNALFSNLLQNQVQTRSSRETQQIARPDTRPQENVPMRERPETTSRPEQRPSPAPEKSASKPAAEKPAESSSPPSPSNDKQPAESADNSTSNGNEQGNPTDNTVENDTAEHGVPSDKETSDTTAENPDDVALLIGAAITAPQTLQPASLAAMVAQIADRLTRVAGQGKADPQLSVIPTAADLPEAAAEGEETDLAQLLTSQQGTKGKQTLLTSADTETEGTDTGKQWKNLISTGDPIIAALRSKTQTLNTRTLSFADIPAAPASSTTALQAELPAGTLQAAGYNPGLRTEQASVPQLQVHTPAGQRVWAEDVGSKLVWMIGRNESKAELMLTPPNLGKLGVSIHTNGDQTTAHFVAATPAAREALEQAMPRLREMLQQAGINLGQTDVSTPNEQQAREDKGQAHNWSGGDTLRQDGEHAEIAHGTTTQSRWISSGNGMVDIFA